MFSDFVDDKKIHILHEDKTLSVSELSASIKGHIEKNFFGVKLQGEISGLKKHSSGHTYLTLKDTNAAINAICWRGTKLSVALEEGAEIVAKGRVTTYPSRSQYNFIIEEATIAGEGALLKLLNERKKKFHALGYFDQKRPIPKFPETIGIITSKTGAVIEDMQHRLRDRYPFCNVILWPVNVQGAEAADQIARAIRGFNIMENKPDVLIIARGGGSIEDLWTFNEEVVVKAVFESSIPTISAIGHETDTTLIDYASDLRAPTPTAAIELCTPLLSDIKLLMLEYDKSLSFLTRRKLSDCEKNVRLTTIGFSNARYYVQNIYQRLDDLSERFVTGITSCLQKKTARSDGAKIINLGQYIRLKSQLYSDKTFRFDKVCIEFISKHLNKVEVFSNRLEQSSYKKILEKGFCFVTDSSGESIKRKSDFISRSNSTLHFIDGTVDIRNN